MNRETIETAAHEYAESIPQSDERKEYSREDFIAGVEWCINSVWHDAKEVPERFRYILISCEYPYLSYMTTNIGWGTYAKNKGIVGWAYLDDLLPERKEVEK